MKVERLQSERRCELWEFFAKNLPDSLRATKMTSGYGEVYGVEVKERDMASYIPFKRGIAKVGSDEIELFHPEYFSDFEEICRNYESVTGKEVTLKFWES